MGQPEHFAAVAARYLDNPRSPAVHTRADYIRQFHLAANHSPMDPTHTGPDGPVRAHRWHPGHPNSHHFVHSAGTVAYSRTPDGAIHIDTDGHGVETAQPGDWLVWTGGQLRVIPAAVFEALYRTYVRTA